jgi:hypothetical protein
MICRYFCDIMIYKSGMIFEGIVQIILVFVVIFYEFPSKNFERNEEFWGRQDYKKYFLVYHLIHHNLGVGCLEIPHQWCLKTQNFGKGTLKKYCLP